MLWWPQPQDDFTAVSCHLAAAMTSDANSWCGCLVCDPMEGRQMGGELCCRACSIGPDTHKPDDGYYCGSGGLGQGCLLSRLAWESLCSWRWSQTSGPPASQLQGLALQAHTQLRGPGNGGINTLPPGASPPAGVLLFQWRQNKHTKCCKSKYRKMHKVTVM